MLGNSIGIHLPDDNYYQPLINTHTVKVKCSILNLALVCKARNMVLSPDPVKYFSL